jgi:hypothetical protein
MRHKRARLDGVYRLEDRIPIRLIRLGEGSGIAGMRRAKTAPPFFGGIEATLTDFAEGEDGLNVGSIHLRPRNSMIESRQTTAW